MKRTGSRAFTVAAVYAICALIVLAPIATLGIPGFGDTLNHLARMHVLATIDHSADLQRFYRVKWTPIPYLAMDIVVPPLLQFLPIYAAGKLFMVLCMLLPVAATAVLHYVVHRRLSLVPCAAFLVSANFSLTMGFLNFLFTAALAILLFAGWIAAADLGRWRRALLFAPGVLALYFGHAFGCLSYCLAVGGLELAGAIRARFRPLPTVLANLAAAFAQAIPTLGFALTLNVSAGYLGPLHNYYGRVGEKIAAFLSPVMFLNDALNISVALACGVVFLLLARYVRLSRALWPACLAVGLAALLIPHVLFSTWWTDFRLPFVTALLLIAALSLPFGRVGAAICVAFLFALLSLKSVDAWGTLRQADVQFAEMRAVLAHLPRGARLLVVNPIGHGTGHEKLPLNTAWNLPLVAVIDRDAFEPSFFTGLTTVRVQPAYRNASTPNGLPITMAQLWEGLATPDDGTDHDDGQGARLYHFGWPGKFDYVLVERYGNDPGKMPGNLALVVQGEDIDLYAVK
jgi:hypothetical protein